MPASEKTILVVDDSREHAESLRELIEFMDTPSVTTAGPADWRERLGPRRMEALFVGSGLDNEQVAVLLDALEKLDPNVPVVMLDDDAS